MEKNILPRGLYINESILLVDDMSSKFVYGYNRKTGRPEFKINYNANPKLLHGNKLIVNNISSLTAFDLIKGNALWSFTNSQFVYIKPFSTETGFLIVGGDKEKYVYHFDDNGTVLSKFDLPDLEIMDTRFHYLNKNLVLLSGKKQFSEKTMLYAIEYTTKKILWELECEASGIAELIASNNYVCLNYHRLDNNAKKKWFVVNINTGNLEKVFEFDYYRTLNLFLVRDKGIAIYDGINITLYDSNTLSNILWKFPVEQPYYLQDIYINNRDILFLLFSDPRMIRYIDTNTGKNLGIYKYTDHISNIFLVYDNIIAYSTLDNCIKQKGLDLE